uniref:Uncharacterized protein n=1 Tax=Magallana gigas TaxID=29159 RepID=K1Q516_MAGGI
MAGLALRTRLRLCSHNSVGPPLNKAKLYKHQNRDQSERDNIAEPRHNRSSYDAIPG